MSGTRWSVVGAGMTFLMLLGMTIGTALAVRAVLRSQSEARFADTVESASNSIRSDLDRSFTELAALEAFVRTRPALTNEEFQTFASTVETRSSVSQALGFAPLVKNSEASVFEAGLAGRGVVGYTLDDFGLKAEYFPIAYAFPPLLGVVDIGSELSSHPVFGPAVEKSRRERALVASPPASSRTNPGGQTWYLVFSPVFGVAEPGRLPSDGPLLGYVFGVYQAPAFLAGPMDRSGLSGTPLRVYDGGVQVLPESGSGDDADSQFPTGRVTSGIDFAGRRWDLYFQQPELFGLSSVERNVWIIVLSAGLGLTLFAAVSMFSLLKARLAARSDLDLMTNQIRVIVDSAIEAIVVVDRANRVVWANQSFADAFGLGLSSRLAGRDWTAVRDSAGVEFADKEAILVRLAEISSSEGLTVTAEDIRIKSPTERALSMTSSPVTDPQGKYLGRLFVYRDVTSERTAEESKSEFISMVSHELRTPLTSMIGYVDLMLDGASGELNREARRLLNIVRRNGNRLAELVSDILDLSRIDSMKFRLEARPVDVAKLLRDVTESMETEFGRKKLGVVLQVPDDLPRIWADPQRAEQVFTNLISNAHRYTPEGGEVTIAARMNGNRVSVSITDTGIGIRPEDQSRIFERFVRVQRGGARPQGSTGLGLAITRALVELHGGTISVKSELGEGSTFTAELPAVNDQGEAA